MSSYNINCIIISNYELIMNLLSLFVLIIHFDATVSPRTFDQFYIENYNIDWVKTSWTDSIGAV